MERRDQARLDGDADARDRQHDLEVVGSDRERAVAQRLQEPDLLPLERDRAGQRDVDEEGRDRQEDRWAET